MRLHIVGCPRNASTKEIPMDPYASVSYYLTTYLHRNNHEVHYYGYSESTVECTKKWPCADRKHLEKYFVTKDIANTHWQDNNEGKRIFDEKAAELILSNYKPGDIVLCMWTPACSVVKTKLANAGFQDVKIVDAHIGHRHPDASTPYRVYASYSNQHYCMGAHDYDDYHLWHETTIYPMASCLDDFSYSEDKDDYHLFMGRTNTTKGITVFLDLARHFPNENFILAGQGGLNQVGNKLPDNVKHVGLLNREDRKEYLSKAKSVISPSYYAEPFGLTSVEAQLSGTPIICTDHGGYTESVIQGVTGFRCSYFKDFVNAIESIDTINPKDCRKNGERFTAENLVKDWDKYLDRVKRGWYDLN